MSAEEHDHDQTVPQGQPGSPAEPAGGTQPGKRGLRSAWLGSRRIAVLAGVVAVGLLTGAGVAFATTGSPAHPANPGAATAATPSPSPSPPSRVTLPHRLPFRIGSMIPSFAGPLGFGGLFGAIHGQYVAPKDGG